MYLPSMKYFSLFVNFIIRRSCEKKLNFWYWLAEIYFVLVQHWDILEISSIKVEGHYFGSVYVFIFRGKKGQNQMCTLLIGAKQLAWNNNVSL